MLSTDETRSFSTPGVGEATPVGDSVGRIAVTVAVGILVGGTLVGAAVEVDSMAGAGAAVQAVRRKKMTMNFRITGNYM
jgi:cyanophycinase-like exopeptidase